MVTRPRKAVFRPVDKSRPGGGFGQACRRRQANNWLGLSPCRRAPAETLTDGSMLSSTIFPSVPAGNSGAAASPYHRDLGELTAGAERMLFVSHSPPNIYRERANIIRYHRYNVGPSRRLRRGDRDDDGRG